MKATIRFKGGVGSGHHGHSGVPGQHGGSAPGGGSGGGSGSSAKKTTPMPANIAELTKRNPRTMLSKRRVIGDNASGVLNATGRKFVTWFSNNGTARQQSKANEILDMDHTGDDVSENSIRDLIWLAKN